ncbi:MAG: phosphoribosylpyrophosphate synthetase [Bacteroidia bacterium]
MGYDTLSEAMNELKKEGYTEDFNLQHDCLTCKNGTKKVFTDDFVIDKFFRFEGNTDPDDESILYAISSPKHHINGVLVNGYGISSEPLTNEMVEKLKTHK